MATTKILMIECMAEDHEDESAFLERLLGMLKKGSCNIKRIKVGTRAALLTKLKGIAAEDWDHVHISAHGEDHEFFCVGDDLVSAVDFPSDCFEDSVVTISACGLGRADFTRELSSQTGAKAIVAPLHDVEMTHAAMFYCLFYYLVVVAGMSSAGAFERTKVALDKKALGGFGYFH